MADLLSLLSLGSAGLSAQHGGASVAANNVANVETPGYSRQRIDLRSQLAAPVVGGVRSGSPQRLEDRLLAHRERDARGASGWSDARSVALGELEGRLQGGTPLEERLTAVWAGLQRVAAAPADPVARGAVVDRFNELAAGFRQHASAIAAARSDSDARIVDAAGAATSLAAQVASLNRAIATSPDPVLRDRRDEAAGKLGELIGGSSRIDPDGALRWVLSDGSVVVDGVRAAQVVATVDPATGMHGVAIVDGASRRDVTTTLTTGRIGGELGFRDGDAAAAAQRVDQLAFDLAAAVNTAHQAGAGLDGVTGRNLFTPLAAVTGAASTIAVDPALLANPTFLASAAPPPAGPGTNQGVVALLALRSTIISGGVTASDAAIGLLGEVGTSAAQAAIEAARDAAIGDHLAGLRDALSGVDLEEELAKLVHFQHASEAMTRFLSTIDGMLGDLLARI